MQLNFWMRYLGIWALVVVLALAGGCTRLPRFGTTSLKPASLAELRGYLLHRTPDWEQFKLRGPFAVAVHKDHVLRLPSGESVAADMYLAALPERAPLVIFLHGYDSTKEDHASQAMHVATWGMHGLALQLPNKGAWSENGRMLARIVDAIRNHPELVDKRIDTGSLVLVGHSFGGSSVAIAMAETKVAAGGILLDPAGIGRDLPKWLGRLRGPVMVLGADQRIGETRNRDYFYHFIPGNYFEVSISGAVHEDAQFPEELPLLGGDSPAAEEMQIAFAGALTAAAFSLAATGKFDYAWRSFGDAVKNGRMFDPKRK